LVYAGWLPGAGRTQLWEIDLDSGERRLRFSDPTDRSFVRYSHTADALAFLVMDVRRHSLHMVNESSIGDRMVTDVEMFPSDWTPDGTAIIGSTTDGADKPWYLAAWQVGAQARANDQMTVLLRDDAISLWGARYSMDGRWLCFNAHGAKGTSVVGVARGSGPPERGWFRVTDGQRWADKPRWSADGRTLFYVGRSEGGVFNLLRQRFDPEAGRAVGTPVQVTSFDSPARTISPDVGGSELGIAPGGIAVSILEASGNIWMLDNVDK
jgi:Tol biopolymer transport system component